MENTKVSVWNQLGWGSSESEEVQSSNSVPSRRFIVLQQQRTLSSLRPHKTWMTDQDLNKYCDLSFNQTNCFTCVCVCVCVCAERNIVPRWCRCVEVDTSARLRSSAQLNINTVRLKPLCWLQDCCQGYIWKKKKIKTLCWSVGAVAH